MNSVTQRDEQAMPHRTAVRVLHVIHGIHFGGAEQLMLSFVREMRRRDVTSVVVCLADGHLFRELQAMGATVYLVPMRSKTDVWVVRRLIPLIRAHAITVLHAHTVRTNLLARLCRMMTGCPIVSTVHAPYVRDTNDTLKPQTLNALIERCSARWTSRFVAVNRRLAGELIAAGISAQRVQTIYNGVACADMADPATEQPHVVNHSAADVVVGMVASFRPRKGAEDLLRAMPRALAAHPSIRCWLVGSGEFVQGRDYLGELRALAGRLGVSARTTFWGFRTDVQPLMRRMDVVVLPSLFGEGLPMALLEAMALRKPVIATRTEGNHEVVADGQTGVLVPPGDPAALAEAILTLAKDPCRREAMGRHGWEQVQHRFTTEQMMDAYRRVYEELSALPNTSASRA